MTTIQYGIRWNPSGRVWPLPGQRRLIHEVRPFLDGETKWKPGIDGEWETPEVVWRELPDWQSIQK